MNIDDDDDDDDDDDELLFRLMVDRRKTFSFIFIQNHTVRDPHHHESLTRHEENVNLRRTWIQA